MDYDRRDRYRDEYRRSRDRYYKDHRHHRHREDDRDRIQRDEYNNHYKYEDDGYNHKRRHYSRPRSYRRSPSRDRDHKRHKNHHHKDSERNARYRPDYSYSRSRDRSKERVEEIPYWDDHERHYRVKIGEILASRYKVISVMGEGTFGKVVECKDQQTKEETIVAVKIIRAIEKYRDAAIIEMEVLESIKKHDPKKEMPVIQMIRWFDYRDHVCMVFDKYGLSLFDFMKLNKYRPFYLKHVQDFAKQILEGIAFLHNLTLIHTDLKPENILLVDHDYITQRIDDFDYFYPKSTAIKLIDFGSATFDSHHHTSIISTRHYRAPEVILGSGWTYPCDIWSIGCILIELYTGDATFQTHENHEHLALFERSFGPLPSYLILKADSGSRKYFDKNNKLIWPSSRHSQNQVNHVNRQLPLEDIINPKQEATHDLFLDLLKKLLEYDPDKRLTANEALKHPFFTLEIDPPVKN